MLQMYHISRYISVCKWDFDKSSYIQPCVLVSAILCVIDSVYVSDMRKSIAM
jgi:hypothetical protein